jgi:hypothetical protein
LAVIEPHSEFLVLTKHGAAMISSFGRAPSIAAKGAVDRLIPCPFARRQGVLPQIIASPPKITGRGKIHTPRPIKHQGLSKCQAASAC